MIIFLLRLVGAIIFGSLGNFLARSTVWPNAPIQVPTWTGLATTIIFAIFGFFIPEIFSFLAKIGIAKLASEIGKRLPQQIPKAKIKLPKRFKIPQNQIIVDTSAIVDGRIFEIVKTGFLRGELVIIPPVLAELQHLADSANELKRLRGRTALDSLEQLKKEKLVAIKFTNSKFSGKTVDDKLLELAKKLNAPLLTCDYNLSKIAKIKNIAILNVNELSQVVRSKVIPGEELTIDLVHAGKTKNQGVGYLPDGTMAVVEDGGNFVGQKVRVKVHRSLQTAAGKMVFSKLVKA